MTSENPPNPKPEENKGKLRAFLMNPWVIGIEFFLIIGIVAGYGIATNPPEPPFEGRGTVVDIEHATKVCNIRLRHEDGKVRWHKMSQYTCKNVVEGEVIDVVAGKWTSKLASEPN